MEKITALIIPVLLTILLIRALLLPIRLIFKLFIHGSCGLICLWLLNSIAPYSGVLFPINTVTVLIAGFLGAPGIGLMALLEML